MPNKKPATLAGEAWMAAHPFFYTHSFQYTLPGENGVQTYPAYNDYHAAVYDAWLGDGNDPSKWKESVIKNITIKIRKPWGIVMSQVCKQSNKKRKVGDSSSHTWQELKIYRSSDRQRSLDALRSQNYRKTDGYFARRAELRLERLELRGTHVLPSEFNGETAGVVATQAMTMPLAEFQGISALQYAETKGGIYVFMTERQIAQGIEQESTRFLTQTDNGYNPVLMWNPLRIQFENNICPYDQRHDHGFMALTHTECGILGIDFFLLFDVYLESSVHIRRLEQASQMVIDHLKLGTQRLHRSPGASNKVEKGPGRKAIGLTVLPENFFENNLDIVIIDSANGRNGY